MAKRRTQKFDATATQQMDLTQEIADSPHVFVGIRFLDGAGAPVTPSSGTYSITILTFGLDNFESIVGGNAIDATADPVSLSFATNATTLKYTPVSVVGAVSVEISVSGNMA